MISTSYDPETDALYVRFSGADIEVTDTREIESGVLLDFDASGSLVGLEVLRARARSRGTAAAA